MTEEETEERIAELVEEYLENRRQGRAIPAREFADAHPEFRDELMELLPAVEDVESLSRPAHPARPVEAHYPDALGGFQLLEKIGSGGMGTVFRALQESLHREVAVKILAPSWSADARHLEAFENESKLIAGLRHTNIVEVYGAGQEGEYRYYVMSLVKGQGLTAQRLVQTFPDKPYAVALAEVGLQAARALRFAHSHGVLHRDIKPGNLLLDDTGVLHVSDFGLATVLNSGEEAPLVTQSHDGTLRYMAPERLTKGINSFAGDQYSLGLTLYELIRKRPAFRETEPGSLIHRICSAPLPPLRSDGELGAIINKSISFSPDDRYASMDDMEADLQRFLNGEPVMARPAPRLRRYAMWCRRRPAVALWSHAAALLVVLLLTSVSIGYMRVSSALQSENEQRVLAEQQRQLAEQQRRLAEKNAQIADAAMQRIFSGMVGYGKADGDFLPPTRADARLIEDLMPYYEEIAAQADGSGDKVAAACHVLATIALQTGDADTAERYFARACEQADPQSLLQVRSTNGLASALYMQGKQEKTRAAREKLLALVNELEKNEDSAIRLELVRSLQMAARNNQWGRRPNGNEAPPRRPPRTGNRESRPDARHQLLQRAAQLLASVLEAEPDNADARLLQVELLSESRNAQMRRLLAPQGESALSLLESLLKKQPQNEEFQRAYVRLVMQPPGPPRGRGATTQQRQQGVRPELKQAVDYARNLLASTPGDSELLMQFLLLSDRYASQLSREGKTEDAARENERTLGVLSFLTNRADFTPEMRERLVMLVGMHPQGAADKEQQEAELKLLLQSYDAERARALREKLQEMRSHRPRRGIYRPGHLPPGREEEGRR